LCEFCDSIVEAVWLNLLVDQEYRTPDRHRGVDFIISDINIDSLKILPQAVTIKKAAFSSAIHYLRIHHHDMDLPCEIRSSTDRASAGPLCLAARSENYGVRCINYILPILHMSGVVGINPSQPNKAWLLRW